MVGLVKEGLVEQIIPGIHLWKLKNIAPAFLEYVDAQDFKTKYRDSWPKIHLEKLQDLAEKLSEKGLAKKHGDPHSPWYKVEPRTAERFMAYLASVLGQITEERFYPITQRTDGLAPFINKSAHQEVQTREIILDAILPTPSSKIEPARLRDFKSEHKNQLENFRLEVEDKISELSAIPNQKDRQRRTQDITNYLAHELMTWRSECASKRSGLK